jgi:superoxide dismutase, Cu-Zn family
MYYTQNNFQCPLVEVYPCYSRVSASKVAYARIIGGPLAPEINGIVIFTEVPGGTEVFVEVRGLPQYQPAQGDKDPIGPHGFHLHENGSCDIGNPESPFQAAGGHWNPTKQPHGNHAGDFPVLFSNNGYARMTFFTDKFSVQQAIGKAVIIHQSPDDYRTQPAGDAGMRLACGVIAPY